MLRLLRGEDMELLGRELGVTAATLSKWRDVFLAAGAKAFKKRPAQVEAEVQRLNAKIGEQAMENELLREKIASMETDALWRGGGRRNEPSRFALH